MKSKNVFGGFTFVVIFGIGLFCAWAISDRSGDQVCS
jgi:hypothetical protein